MNILQGFTAGNGGGKKRTGKTLLAQMEEFWMKDLWFKAQFKV